MVERKGLPVDFVFSQSSLQDYVDCPRLFELRYLRHVAWPMRFDPEGEQRIERGLALHRLLHQYYVGVAEALLLQDVDDGVVASWVRAFLRDAPSLPAERFPELGMRAAVPELPWPLEAKYDLLAVGPERAVIVDWKTSKRRPARQRLAGRMQTLVYPFVLCQTGGTALGRPPLAPEQVVMVYWFTAAPDQPERFEYDRAQHEWSEGRLAELMREIAAAAERGDFPEQGRRCQWCRYKTFCDIEKAAGDGAFDDMSDEAWALEEDGMGLGGLDLEQVVEVEF